MAYRVGKIWFLSFCVSGESSEVVMAVIETLLVFLPPTFFFLLPPIAAVARVIVMNNIFWHVDAELKQHVSAHKSYVAPRSG